MSALNDGTQRSPGSRDGVEDVTTPKGRSQEWMSTTSRGNGPDDADGGHEAGLLRLPRLRTNLPGTGLDDVEEEGGGQGPESDHHDHHPRPLKKDLSPLSYAGSPINKSASGSGGGSGLRKRMSVKDTGRLKNNFDRVRRAQSRLSSDSLGTTASATTANDGTIYEDDEGGLQQTSGDDLPIDWEFWAACLDDYEEVAQTRPEELSRAIQAGIPTPLRGMIWQLMSQSKSEELEMVYGQLLQETSPHEKSINRDLSRTFPYHMHFSAGSDGQDSLYNVIKAYSLYDTDVGYCQGLPFIVGPLLLNMPEEEAFCVLVSLMKSYDFRLHFTPGMPSLQLHLFQFDKLVHHFLPRLHAHMTRVGVKSSMYASQWFMTLFAYKFPLDLVFRIFDIVFAEGIEAIFRFSIALLRKEERTILSLDFEQLLQYLKTGLFDSYRILDPEDGESSIDVNDSGQSQSSKQTETPSSSSNSNRSKPSRPDSQSAETALGEQSQWRTNEFVRDAFSIHITTSQLNRYAQEWQVEHEREETLQADCDRLKLVNVELTTRLKSLENDLTTLTSDHHAMADELIQLKLDNARLSDENEAQQAHVMELKSILDKQAEDVSTLIRSTEVEPLKKIIQDLGTERDNYKLELGTCHKDLIDTKIKWAQVNEEYESLRRRWEGVRREFH